MEEVNKEVVVNDEASHAFIVNHGVSISMGPLDVASSAPKVAHKEPVANIFGINDIAIWGEDNLFPQNVIADAEFSTLIQPTLEWKASALFGGGIQYGFKEVKPDGTIKRTPKIDDPIVNEFFRRTNINRYLRESITDLYWFYNPFPSVMMSRDRKNVAMLKRNDASFCRWQKQNPNTGLIDNCYLSARWNFGSGTSSEFVTQIPTIDPYFDPAYTVRQRDEFQYIYPLSFPTPGKTYYSLAAWNTIRTSKWFELMKQIPIFKNAIIENQASIKYHIEIYTWWWEWKYPDWQSLGKEEKRKLREAELKNFNDVLTGSANAGKTLMTAARIDNGEVKPGWKITAIDNKIMSGSYIEDSQEGSTHFLYALGVDPTLIGQAPGKGMGAGSGSDKRVAFNLYLQNCHMHESIILEPLYFVRDYNHWDPNYEFWFEHDPILTQDKVSDAPKQAAQNQ